MCGKGLPDPFCRESYQRFIEVSLKDHKVAQNRCPDGGYPLGEFISQPSEVPTLEAY